MQIRIVSIIGLGALGILFGNHLSKYMPAGDLRIIADRDRIARYEQEGVYCNGKPCKFNFTTPEESGSPADLIILAVKYNGLNNAINAVKNQVGGNTILLSLLNGITSEAIIGQAYGMDNVLYSVAQGMDAVKVGNQMTYEHMGMICFGDREPGVISPQAQAVADFFAAMKLPYELDGHMPKRLWGKLLLNVGVNQAVAVYGSNYGDVQKKGTARDIMIAAMREVITLSEKENICLTEEDLSYWLRVVDSLSPLGKPSMRQDIEARRPSEVELFAGTVIALGEKYNVPTPINKMLYEKIMNIEGQY
ncbi:MAG: ketopantoate reductase family protein [Syntrophomonadaceae bacterium]|nr:ketopantoate reductase family protein [Syntrophomonadaceae bacterium]